MTTTHTIDPTDGLDTSEREAAEARAFEVGSKLVEEQAAAQEERYESARQTEEANLRYAGKYKSAEDLEKAYLELQRKLGEQGASSQEEPADESEEAPEQEDQDQGEEEEADEVVEILQKANEEFYSESGLTKDTIEELAKLDSRTLVEKWAEYVQSQQEQAKEQQGLQQADVDRVMKAVGGTDNYNQMLAWAGENLSPDEVSAYDEVMNSGNADAIYWAALGLKSRYADAVGIEGTVYTGARAPKAEPGFRSQAELARAIADPRYRDDPAYRLDVEAKLARSGDLL
jgi:hypothetical protein